MDSFFDKIKKQLKSMSEAEKDAWILSQAKILPDFKQEDFYKSICGTKKVISMPERSEITGFCEKVRKGDIVVEYETHLSSSMIMVISTMIGSMSSMILIML